MTVSLNERALDHARSLIRDGDVVRDQRDDWSEAAPSADAENAYVEANGYADYGLWFLGVDDDMGEDTKGRYSFPYGDFSRVHRGGVISLESRAGQYHHAAIEKAAKELLDLIDAGS